MNATTATSRLAAFGLAWILLLGAAATAPAAEELPSAREVVDRFVAAIGGAERMLERTAATLTGTFAVPAQGLQGKLQIWTAAPDLMLMEVEIPGYGKIRSGHDGSVGWMVDPAMGAQVLADKSLDQTRDQANFHSLLYRPGDYTSLEVVGRTDFQGTPCYELAVVSKSGLASQQYFAVDSGLLVGTTQKQYTPMGEIPSTTALKDYREFAGLKIATVMEQSMMGMQQVVTIESVTYEPLDAAIFALPAAVASLVEAGE